MAVVREARGLVSYHQGDWKVALNEFRTARRLSGSHHLLPYLVDIERALGRPERALELSASPESLTLDAASRIELDIVVSGVRRDMGDMDAALLRLRGPELDATQRKPWSARLFYAYADTLLEMGREDEARSWFAAAVEADPSCETDAAERLDELDGTIYLDLGDDEEDEEVQEAGESGEVAEADESGEAGESGEVAESEDGASRPDVSTAPAAGEDDEKEVSEELPANDVTDAQPEPDPEADPETQSEPGAELQPEPESEVQPEPEPEVQPEPEADREPEAAPEAQPEPGAELETEAQPQLEAQPEVQPETEPEPEPQPEPETEEEP